MLLALRAYLLAQGYTDVCVDWLPAAPEACIGLFGWDDDQGPARDGTATHYIQIQVRGPAPDEVRDRCGAIGALLDSGINERPIPLPYPGTVIGTLRRGPRLLDRANETVTYYCEVALWGDR